MNVAIFCIFPAILLLSCWGFASLMRTIAILRGWNPKLAFWGSAAVLALAQIGYFLFGFTLLASYPEYDILLSIPYYAILAVSILSPILNLVLKSVYRDALRQTSSGSAKSGPIHQVPAESEPGRRITPPAPASSGHIFISYRRSDSADIAGRIYDRLIGRFGRDPIFKDVDSIPLGYDFKEYLDKKVGECDVLLAIIGDRWLEAADAEGKIRLEDPADFVRIEIESALQRGIPVIPLLVRGAGMPIEESLPQGLRKLVYRNGIPIRSDPDFHRDMDRLIGSLEKYVGQK